jgi:hypothetical protein
MLLCSAIKTPPIGKVRLFLCEGNPSVDDGKPLSWDAGAETLNYR